MRTKHALMLLILVLVCGFTSSPGSGKNQDNDDRTFESKIGAAEISDLNCKLQTKSSTVRSAGGGNLTVSINSNWLCR